MKNNKQKLNLFAFTFLLFAANMSAQVVQKIGDNSFTIDTNSVLELESTNKGLLLPRLALTTTSSILPMTGTVASGMIVYNTATAGDVTPGFYFYNVDKWVRVADNAVITASNITGAVAVANGGTGATTAAAALTNLGAQAASNLSSNITTDTGSTTMYPSVSAVQAFVNAQVATATPDATTSIKGKIQLAGDLAGTAAAPLVAAGAIDDSKISETAAILDTKLATIATAGKVSNSATTATASNTVNTIVLRDGSGNFSAGAITATSFTGSGAGLTGVVSSTNANLTGMVTSVGNTATVVTNANLTGEVTSTGNATTVTNSAVITKVLTGFTSGAGTVSDTDTVLGGIQKLDGNIALKANLASPTFTGTPTLPTGTIGVTQTAGNSSTALATTAFVAAATATNANLTGEVTSVGNAATVTNAAVITKVLTGFTSGAGTVSDTDTVLGGIQKLDGNIALKANLASPTFTGTPTLPTGTIGVTQTVGNSSTALATTAFVSTAVNLHKITSKTADYTLLTTDSTIMFDTSAALAAGLTLTIPTADAVNTGKIYIIIKDESNVKLNFSPSIYLTASTSFSSINYAKTIRIQSDGSKWCIIN